jgi:hypothetical protein
MFVDEFRGAKKNPLLNMSKTSVRPSDLDLLQAVEPR